MDKRIYLLYQEAERLRALGRRGDEESCLQQILQLDPVNHNATFRLGQLRSEQGFHGQAMGLFQSIVNRGAPTIEDQIQDWYWLATSSLHCGLHDQSSQWMTKVVKQGGSYRGLGELVKGYAGELFSKEQYGSALKWFQQAFDIHPHLPGLHLAIAKTLHNLRRVDEAEKWYQVALEHNPQDPLYRWEYAMQLLITGRFEEGWQAYESRLDCFDLADSGLHMFDFQFPRWSGESLEGKTLLVHGEQGIGDEIMFSSMIPELLGICQRLIVACTPSLVSCQEGGRWHQKTNVETTKPTKGCRRQ